MNNTTVEFEKRLAKNGSDDMLTMHISIADAKKIYLQLVNIEDPSIEKLKQMLDWGIRSSEIAREVNLRIK